ncbi:MAG: choice-of-anchor J domain-containing protein [Clostridia bacterium]|nr:choice-of-anchor J domain-containing protein [Clostridia bacterium]
MLGDAQTGTNTVTLNAAGKLNEGDKLYVFNEQCNGDKKTDFASPLVEITDAPVFYEIPKCDLATLNDGDYWFDLHKLLEDEGYRCSEDIFTDLQLFSYFYVSADGSTALIKKNVDDFYEEHHFEYLTYTAGDARFAYLKQHVTPTCGAVAFTEEFEREPTGWTFVDSDGDGHGWNHNICDYSVFDTRQSMHSGNGILYSESYLNHSGPLTPDNWAITPAIVVPEEAATLTFWVTGQDSWDFAEHYGVYVYEAADPAAPALPAGKPADYMKTKLMEQTNDSPNAYVENTVDLSDYAGKTVFLAFRHFDCTNQYHLNLDSVTVKGINHTYGDTGADRYTCTVCGTMNEARKAACAGAPDMTVSAPTVTYGSNAVITATLPSDATGTVRFTLTSEKDGTTIGPFNADVSDGTAQISQKLGADTYAVSAIYSGDGDLYLTKTAGASLTVNPADPVITMTSEPTNEAGTEARVTITIPADAKGDVLLKMTAPSGKINTVAMAASFFENGVRTMDVPADYPFFFTETGEYQFVASFSNDPSDPDGTNYNNAPDAATLTFELGCNHVWATPTWVWDDNDLSQVTYSTTCTLGCETKASDKVVPTKGTRVEATLNDDAYTTYTAEVTLGTQTFSDEHKVYEPGTMQAAREQAFNEYKAQIITGIEGKALEGDSNAAAQLIEDAAAAVEGVTYDRSQGLEENKAAVDNAANLPALENALTDQRAADAVETAINEIGQVEYTDESKGKIDAARAAYDALTDTQKALVPDEAKQALTDAQAAYQLLEDKAEFEAYKDAAKDAADALGKADDSAKTAALIEAAKKAIDDVPYNQSISLDANKAAVDAAANFDALDEALADQRAADAVEAKINAIGQIALNDECKARVEDAKAAYDALTDAQKALLPLNAQYALFDAVAAFQQMDDEKAFAYYKEVVKGIADMFAEEGDSEKATALIEAAKQAVDELAYDKSLTRDENLDAIEAAADLKGLGDKLDDQRAADAAENAINAIGDVALTDECKGKIDAARAAYDALTDAQKALVPDEAKQALTDAEQEYADRAAFEEYKEEKKTALDALAKEGDSAAAQQIIEDAKTQIDALEYDDAKPLADNKAAADAIVANAEKALETQRTADCPLCGKGHENGFFDKLLGVIHRALYYVNLYGRIAVFYFFQMIMRF